jgi:hypothetical protein
VPYKLFAPFERLLADDLNTYYSQQVAAIFPNAASRDAAIPAPIIGQPAFLTDLMRLTVWDGSAWRAVAERAAYATLTAAAAHTILNNTTTKLTLPTVLEDSHGFALGNNELTIPAGMGGMYGMAASVQWANQATAAGYRACWLRINDSTPIARAQDVAHNNGGPFQNVMGTARLADGDLLSVAVHHTAGVNLNSVTDTYGPFLRMWRIGD